LEIFLIAVGARVFQSPEKPPKQVVPIKGRERVLPDLHQDEDKRYAHHSKKAGEEEKTGANYDHGAVPR